MSKKFLIFFFLGLSASLTVAAENKVEQGESLAAACSGCHGEKGNSAIPDFPKLAGQHASYLTKQLLAFKNGTRKSPMMAPLAMGLDKKDIEKIAAYYAQNKISHNEMPLITLDEEVDEDELDEAELAELENEKKAELQELLALGSDLYRNGDLEREVSACIACHGPYGEGNKPAAFPSLHSQHADYIIKSLTDYKNGSRANNPDNMMHMIAKKMTHREIKAVAYHISMMK